MAIMVITSLLAGAFSAGPAAAAYIFECFGGKNHGVLSECSREQTSEKA